MEGGKETSFESDCRVRMGKAGLLQQRGWVERKRRPYGLNGLKIDLSCRSTGCMD